MDIYSNKGKVAADIAAEEIAKINSYFRDIQLVPFQDEYPVRYDGVAIKDGFIKAAYEIRTRNAPIEDGNLIYKGGQGKYDTLLITKEKIDECVRISKEQYLEFWLFVKFLNCTLYWPISDHYGRMINEFDTVTKKTRKSVNGGTAERENYLVPFAQAITIFQHD